jgi:NitT/TauT family transport system substrate-binding protein
LRGITLLRSPVKAISVGAVVAALATGALSGCGSDGGTSAGGNGMTDVKIAVTQWPSLQYGVPYQVGMEEGCFKKQGINITGVVAGTGGGTTVRSVLAGDLAFGEAATSAIVTSYNAGAPLTAVSGGGQSMAPTVWVTRPDSPLKSIEDLKGHSVGYTNPGSVTQSALAMSLKAAGVSPDSVDMRATGGASEGLTALDGGALDATVFGEPPIPDPSKYKILFRAGDLIPKLSTSMIFTNNDMIKNHPDVIKKFLAGRACGVQYMHDHPDESAAIWSKKGDISLADAKETMTALLAADEWSVSFSPDGLTAAEQGMQLAGVIGKDVKVPWKDIINQKFLPAGAEAVTLP